MATVHESQVREDSVEELLEELLTELVTGTRSGPPADEGESFTANLTEAVMASFSGAITQSSMTERALLADAVAPALAEALAPAIAKALAPEIVTAFSHLAAADEQLEEEPDYAYDESGEAYDDAETAYSELEAEVGKSARSKKAR